MKPMRCGNCGEPKHEIFKYEKTENLMVKCTKCGNKSKITLTKPEIEIAWVKDQNGLLAQF